ncbi:MAG: MerC domain-containing protein [Pseudomonadota bacterium]
MHQLDPVIEPKANAGMQKSLDVAAISASTLCAVHCLLTPVALIIFPVLTSSLFTSEDFHFYLLWLILPTSVLAMALGCLRHKDTTVVWLGGAGLLALVLAALWGHELLGGTGERLATLTGGVLLIAGHLRNYRLCREDHCHA